jgi:hypothetical protein
MATLTRRWVAVFVMSHLFCVGAAVAQEASAADGKADGAATPAPDAPPAPAAPESPVIAPDAGPEAAALGKADVKNRLRRYDSRFSEVEEQIDKLKEEIFGSKTRLMLLREQVLHNVVAGTYLVIVHENDIGPGFTLERVIYYLDKDKKYFAENNDGQLDERKRFVIQSGTIVPGNHVLDVEMTFRGSGGPFTYVKGYKFKVKSSFTFFASKGKILQINVMGYPKGGFAAKFEDRPDIRYMLKQVRYTKENRDALLQELQ